MDNYLQNPAQASLDYDGTDKMYPDVFRIIKPYADDAVEAYGGQAVTEEELDSMARNIVSASNIMSNPPRGHNQNTINDIAKLIILNNLYGGYGYGFPGFRPYSHSRFPVAPIPSGRRGHFGRGRY